jgi:LacI family transcriptional regulator
VPVTMRDVAERAGVSIKTVSRVLNGERHVRDGVRDAVQRVMEQMDYRPNPAARSLSSSRSYLLAFFTDAGSWSSYILSMQHEVLARARMRGYHLIVEPIDLRRPDWDFGVTETLDAFRFDGAVLVPPACDDLKLLGLLERAGVPYCRISPRSFRGRSGMVDIDEKAAAAAMVEHLVREGHERIGFIHGPEGHGTSELRLRGFQSAHRRAALPFDVELVRPGELTFEGGREAARAMLTAVRPPTAIFAGNDEMTMGAIAEAEALDIDIPSKIVVAGFEDSSMTRLLGSVSVIRQPIELLASAAIDVVIDAGYRDEPDDPRWQVRLPFTLSPDNRSRGKSNQQL